MRPPICDLCHERFSAQNGGLVRFSNYTPLPDGMVGHPKGLAWFCPTHIEAARTLTELTRREAISELRLMFPRP